MNNENSFENLFETLIEGLKEDIKRAEDQYKSFINILIPFIKEIIINYDKKPSFIEILRNIRNKGWFISFDYPLKNLVKLFNYINSKDYQSIDKSLVRYYERKLKIIQSRLCSWYPDRLELLKLAFQAHEEGKYALAIPIFFTQIEGICKKEIGESPYKKKKKVLIIAEKLKNMDLNPIYVILAEDSPFIYNEKKRSENPGVSLNRHAVMHGESVDYGTEINSLKAISYIYFWCQALKY